MLARLRNTGQQAVFWAELTATDPSLDELLDKFAIPRHRFDRIPLVWNHDPSQTRCVVPAGGIGAMRIARLLVSDGSVEDEASTLELSAEWEAQYANSHQMFHLDRFSDDTLIEVMVLADPPLQRPCRVDLRLRTDGTVENRTTGESFQADLSLRSLH